MGRAVVLLVESNLNQGNSLRRTLEAQIGNSKSATASPAQAGCDYMGSDKAK